MESGATYEVTEPLSVNGARVFVCDDTLIHMTMNVNHNNVNNVLNPLVHIYDTPDKLEIRENFRKKLYMDMMAMYEILQSSYVHSLRDQGFVNVDLVSVNMESAIQNLKIYRQSFAPTEAEMAICQLWSRTYAGIWANNGGPADWPILQQTHIASLKERFNKITQENQFRFVYDIFLSLYPNYAGSMYIEYHRQFFLTAAIQDFWAYGSDVSAVERRRVKARAQGRDDVNWPYRRNEAGHYYSYNGPKTYAEFIAPYLPMPSNVPERSRTGLTVFKNPLNDSFERNVCNKLTPLDPNHMTVVERICSGNFTGDARVDTRVIRRSISFDIQLLDHLFQNMIEFILLSIINRVDPRAQSDIYRVETNIRNILTSWSYIINLDFGPLSIHRALFVCALCRQTAISIALYLPLFQAFIKQMEDQRKLVTTAYATPDANGVRSERIDRTYIPEEIGIGAYNSHKVNNDFIWILNHFNPFVMNSLKRTAGAIFEYVSKFCTKIKQPEYFNTHYNFHANAHTYMKSIGESIASIQLFRWKSDDKLYEPWFHYKLFDAPYNETLDPTEITAEMADRLYNTTPDVTKIELITIEMANKFLMLLQLVKTQQYGDILSHIKGNHHFREIAFMFSSGVTWNQPGITVEVLSLDFLQKFGTVA